MNIMESDIVKNEILRIRNAEKDFEERNVDYDIQVLTEALNKINNQLFISKNAYTVVKLDMWEECHDSLDKIMEHFGLMYIGYLEYSNVAVKLKAHNIFDTQLNKWTDHTLESLCDTHMLDDYKDPDFEDHYKQGYEEYHAGKWTEKQMINYVENRGYKVEKNKFAEQ